jgi:hypothetical protein
VNNYSRQNSTIHQARSQLERLGVLDSKTSLEQLRDMAAEMNDGVRSISALSLEQRKVLIDRLISMGSSVTNITIYESDLRADVKRTRQPRKVLNLFGTVAEDQLRMVDSVARSIRWPAPDSYERLCVKLFEHSRPQNNNEVRRLLAVLTTIIKKDKLKDAAGQGR